MKKNYLKKTLMIVAIVQCRFGAIAEIVANKDK